MPNTALNRTTQVLLTNKSGGALTYGAVVVVDTTTDSSFTTTTTGGYSAGGVGVILEPSGIANNAAGMVAVGGWVPQINLNTAATRGQFIKTHTVAGQGTPHSSPQVEGDFAVALTASATPPANLFGSPNGAVAGGSGTVTNTGTLTAGQPVIGNAGVDVKVDAKFMNGIVSGRLTTESGVPVSTTDRTSQSTIYFTPYNGNQIALYTSSVWVVLTFSQISLALSGLTSGKNYDVFVDYNAGTPQLVLSAAWASDTTRTDSLALQDGVYVKSGTTTYRWVGTIRTTSTTTTEDSGGYTGTTQVGGKRFVWNLYNQVRRVAKVVDLTDQWSYTTNTWRQADAASGNKVEAVIGLDTQGVEVSVVANISLLSNVSRAANCGIGVDSTTAPSGLAGVGYDNFSGGFITNMVARYNGTTGIGYHYFAWLEKGPDGTGTFKGDDGGTGSQSGLTATLIM